VATPAGLKSKGLCARSRLFRQSGLLNPRHFAEDEAGGKSQAIAYQGLTIGAWNAMSSIAGTWKSQFWEAAD
jgi:hypothetical protein